MYGGEGTKIQKMVEAGGVGDNINNVNDSNGA